MDDGYMITTVPGVENVDDQGTIHVDLEEGSTMVRLQVASVTNGIDETAVVYLCSDMVARLMMALGTCAIDL